MKRTVVLTALFFAVLLVPPAAAGGLSQKQARTAAAEQVFRTSPRFFDGFQKLDCSRVASRRFSCVVVFTQATRWNRRSCRSRIRVTGGSAVTTRTLKQSCRKLPGPYLGEAQARRRAVKLLDPRSRSKGSLFTGESGGYERNRYEFTFYWDTPTENCMQTIKVALVSGSVRANAGEAACSPVVPWP